MTERNEILLKMQCAAKARAEGQHALAAAFDLQCADRELELVQRAPMSNTRHMDTSTAQLGMSYLATFDMARFVFAGKATFTLVSNKTGTRFTYKVRAHKDVFFVSVLTGSDNEVDYTFLGTVFADGSYRRGYRSVIGPSAPSARAFEWAFPRLKAGDLGDLATIHHESKCGRCGRKLTVPESIASGFGPECAQL